MGNRIKVKCAYSKCGVEFTPIRKKDGPQYHSDKCRVGAWRENKQKKP